MSGLSTHVLDLAAGAPAADIGVRLYFGDREINSARTNQDGRCAHLLPDNTPLAAAANPSPLSIGYNLEEYVALIAEAADKVE